MPPKVAQKATWVLKLLQELDTVRSQYFKKLSGRDLWECRVGLGGRIYRFLAFWDAGALIILTHGFEKKTQKTPLQEINKALNLKADWERRK